MVTDPPADDEDAETGSGDGSVDDEDPIEEVDFWEEVGETRPAREEDLAGTDETSTDPAPEAGEPEEALPDRDGSRWPGSEDAGPDAADEDPESPVDRGPDRDEDAFPDRPSSEISAEERLARSSDQGIDLGVGPDREPDDETAADDAAARVEPGDPTARGEADPQDPAPEAESEDPVAGPDSEAGDREPEPWPDAPDPDLAAGAEADEDPEPEVETAPPEAATGPETDTETGRLPEVEDLTGDPGVDGDAPTDDDEPPTEIVTDLDLGTDVERTVPRLRERGPVEAGDAPLEGVEEADGPCHVCTPGEDQEPTPGRHTCVSCEEPACSSHFWVMFGLCEGCATEEQIRKLRGERTQGDWAAFLGIKWVD